MKRLIFCIMLMLICIPVHAKEGYFYFDDQRVEDMWITKTDGNKTESYRPYFLKRKGDNVYGYCIEPLVELYDDIKYIQDNDYTKYGFTKEQLDRINLIIYYGYGYDNHTEDKWYGITQFLVWKTTGKVTDIYFTDKKNGEPKELYVDEINEIENLIKQHNIEPNFIKDYTISVNSELRIDSNVNLNDYTIDTDIDYKIENNKIMINNVSKGEYTFTLSKKSNRFEFDFLLYNSSESQNVIIPGNSPIYEKEYSFNISVKEGKLTLEKISSYNGNKLEGATYGVYKDNELIGKVTTNKDGLGEINLPFGIYSLKEIEAPAGYKLDDNSHELIINESNLDIKLTLTDDKEIIEVPNTGLTSKKNYSLFFIVTGLIGLLYGQKKYCMH